MQDPNEDTEWNDVLRQKGIIPPKVKEAEVTEEQIENLVDNVVKEYTSDGKNPEEMELNELEELEDDLDERVFEQYRQKRLAELKTTQRSARFGDVLEITAQDYIQEVNKAGDGVWVVLHLYKQGIPLCSLINQHMRTLANKFPATKFIKSISTLCIANYPDKNLPTIFIYHNGQMKKQIIGTASFPAALKTDELEWMLSESGAVKTDLECDPRHKIKDALFSQLTGSNSTSRNKCSALSSDSESDNDW